MRIVLVVSRHLQREWIFKSRVDQRLDHTGKLRRVGDTESEGSDSLRPETLHRYNDQETVRTLSDRRDATKRGRARIARTDLTTRL